LPLTGAKAFRSTLSFHRKYMPHMIYRGQKSISSGVPIQASAGVLPLAMQALLVTLLELFLNYKTSAGRGESGTGLQGKQASQNT
jgi:hypothetical protein